VKVHPEGRCLRIQVARPHHLLGSVLKVESRDGAREDPFFL
jgi:hypothetical protein